MLDIAHILESALGLTIGGVLIKLFDKTCESQCSNAQPVSTIVASNKNDDNDDDAKSYTTIIPDYDVEYFVTYNNERYHTKV